MHRSNAARAWSATVLALVAIIASSTRPQATTDEVLNSTDPLLTAVNVSPSDGLADGRAVTVGARGFHVDSTAQIMQCSPAPFVERSSATCELRASAVTDGVGSLAAVRVVLPRVINASAASVDCAPPTACGLYVTTGASGQATRMAGHHLTFVAAPANVLAPSPATTPVAPVAPVVSPVTGPVPPAAANLAPAAPTSPPAAASVRPVPGVANPRSGAGRSTSPGTASAGPGAPAAVAEEPAPVPPPAVQGEALTAAPSPAPPTAQVRPDTVRAGQFVTISGTGFGPAQRLDLTLGKASVLLATQQSDDLGGYSRLVRIPADAPVGRQEVVVSSPADGLRAVAQLNVLSASNASQSGGAPSAGKLLPLVVVGVVLLAISQALLFRRRRRLSSAG